MTKQTWTAAVSALLFVIAAAVVALTPVPFVALAPGTTHDLLAEVDGLPVVSVEDFQTFDATGKILLTTVSATRPDAAVSLPEAIFAHWAADRQVFPRDFVYPDRASATEIRTRESTQLAASQADAAAAALRAAGIEVARIPMIQSVASTGPAEGKLFPGDFILRVDDEPTVTAEEVRAAVETRLAGEPVHFTVLRDREQVAVTIDTTNSRTNPGLPVWGGQVVMGYSYTPVVNVTLNPELGGNSGGLMMAMAIFDRITPGAVTGGHVLAGTGSIDGAGNVGPVSGVREKLLAAERAGAEVFFVPAANCGDLRGATSVARIVSVGTLEDALNSLALLSDPNNEKLVKGCA